MRTKLCLLSLFILSSCIQEIPIRLTDSEHQVVVTGLICPDTTITLNISTLSAFNDIPIATLPKILDVSLMEDGISVGHPTVSSLEIQTRIYPNVGSLYTLTIRTDTDTLIASTRIPSKVLLTQADYWFSKVPSAKFEKPVEATITWEDPAGIDNYYELQILNVQLKAESFYQFDQIDDPVIQQECDLDYAPSSFVFSDKQFDGKFNTITLRFGIGYSSTRPGHAYVVLRNVSEEYYHFKKSWHKHIFLQNTTIGWDGNLNFTNIYSLLFYGDPISLFTNVKQGLGIFAGYNEDIRKFRFVEK